MSENEAKAAVHVDTGESPPKKRLSARRISCIIGVLIVVYILVVVFLIPPRKSVDWNGAPLDDGHIVRHRVDGRIGIVTWSKGGQCGVRFSCNYSSPKIYELVTCESFELILLSQNEEGNLYWRWNRREVPSHDPSNP